MVGVLGPLITNHMAYSHLTEAIERSTGKFSKQQYFVSNPTKEDITIGWALREPEAPMSGSYTIKSGDFGGPYPQFLAYHIVKHLTNREIINDGKEATIANPNVRDEYESKYLKPVVEGEEDPRVTLIREEERHRLEEEIKVAAGADAGITSSETKRELIEEKKAAKAKKEFEGANAE